MKVESNRLPHGEELPLLIDSDGMPVPAANEWLLTRRDKASNTLGRNLRELIPLFQWLEDRNIDLWERISSGQGFTEAEVRGSLLEALRRGRSRGSTVVELSIGPESYNQRLDTTARFLKWIFGTCLSSLPSEHRSYDRIQANLDLILRWFSDSRMSPQPNRRAEKALTQVEQAYLLDCLDPSKAGYDSYGRPATARKKPEARQYGQALRHRNFVITALLLFCGLRRGELLNLWVDDVVTGSAIPQVDVVRRDSDPDDQRTYRPQVKRLGRPLPLAPRWARIVDEYITEYRDILLDRGDEDTNYLILASNGRAMSLAQVDKIFRQIRAAHPERLPVYLTPHTLRHCFSINMLIELQNAGLPEDEARRQLAALRGDASEKSQDAYVATQIAKQASERLLAYQQRLADASRDVPL